MTGGLHTPERLPNETQHDYKSRRELSTLLTSARSLPRASPSAPHQHWPLDLVPCNMTRIAASIKYAIQEGAFNK